MIFDKLKIIIKNILDILFNKEVNNQKNSNLKNFLKFKYFCFLLNI